MRLLPWRQLRAESVERLRAARVEDPDQEVRWIIERASGRTPSEQVASLDEPATEREARSVDQMVLRRLGGEPLQYVLGEWGFRTLHLFVDPRVLIPRPETEVVAELAIAVLPSGGTLVDLGTGSGAIALSVAAERWPDVEVWGSDASADALAVARANLAGLGRRAAVVRPVEGSWYDALPDELRGRVDVVVSNPPYVAAADLLPSEVADWEPAGALVSGPTGLEAVEVIVAGADEWLAPEGTLVIEIGDTQGAAVLDLAHAAGFTSARIEQDLAGRDRALVARST
jgi:release factor glutamine methyltransferase